LAPYSPPLIYPEKLPVSSRQDKKTRPLVEDASDAPQSEFKRLYNKRTDSCNFSCADYTIFDLRGMSMPVDITSLLRKMDRSRAWLDAALDRVTPQMEVYPSWRIKQVMDHIAGWDELVYLTLEAYVQGNTPPSIKGMGFDQYNAASVASRSELTLQQSRQAYESARHKVLQSLRELPAEMLTREYPAPWGDMCTIPEIMKIFVSHELEHARHIEAALKQPEV
jgi:hypothetical protein